MAEVISLFLTATHNIRESPKTVCWELQDYTSYRLKVNNSLGFTDCYTHPGEVSECCGHVSSSCPVFKVLQDFAAASTQYTLWISFCFSPRLQSRRVQRRMGGCLSGHSGSPQPGNARMHRQQPGASYSGTTSASHSRTLIFCPGCYIFWMLHCHGGKGDSVKIYGVITGTHTTICLFAVSFI